MPIDPKNLSSTATLTFADEFDALSLRINGSGTWDTNYHWGAANGVTLSGNGELEWYIDANYAPTSSVKPWTVSNGVLDITAAPAAADIKPLINNYDYTSGMLTTYHTFSQTYGYFEMRAEVPAGAGLWPAFWLLPADGSWPPELDVMEQLGNDPYSYYGSAHSNSGGQHTSVTGKMATPNLTTGYHTYGVDWEADKITWYFDGAQVYQTATPSDMNQPMYMIVNLAVGGYWPGNPTPDTHFPATLHVDYIHAYAAKAALQQVFSLPESGAPTKTFAGTQKQDKLVGSSGNDLIDGKTNADTMAGQLGDDTYSVDNAKDVVTEKAGEGVDSVWSYLQAYTLTANVENLYLKGTAAQAGVGNDLGNILVSNNSGSTINGGAGNDVIVAGGGPDMLTGGSGSDVFRFNFAPSAAGRVTDFQVGTDMLDLRGLFAGYKGSDPVADQYLKLVANAAGGTAVMFDADGAGSGGARAITTLDHVSPSTLHLNGDIWFI